MATVGCPEVTKSGTASFFGKTKVNGPGLNCLNNAIAASFNSATS